MEQVSMGPHLENLLKLAEDEMPKARADLIESQLTSLEKREAEGEVDEAVALRIAKLKEVLWVFNDGARSQRVLLAKEGYRKVEEGKP